MTKAPAVGRLKKNGEPAKSAGRPYADGRPAQAKRPHRRPGPKKTKGPVPYNQVPEPAPPRAVKFATARSFDAASVQYGRLAAKREHAKETGIGRGKTRFDETDCLLWDRVWREEGSVTGNVMINGRRTTPPVGEPFAIPMTTVQTWPEFLLWLRSPEPLPSGAGWDGRAIDWHVTASSKSYPAPHGQWNIHLDESQDQRAVWAERQRTLAARIQATSNPYNANPYQDPQVAQAMNFLQSKGITPPGGWGNGGAAGGGFSQWGATSSGNGNPLAAMISAFAPANQQEALKTMFEAFGGANNAKGMEAFIPLFTAMIKANAGGGGGTVADKMQLMFLDHFMEQIREKKEEKPQGVFHYDQANGVVTIPGLPFPIPMAAVEGLLRAMTGKSPQEALSDVELMTKAKEKKEAFAAAAGIELSDKAKDIEVKIPGIGPVSLNTATAVTELATTVGSGIKGFAKEFSEDRRKADREEREAQREKEEREQQRKRDAHFAGVERTERENKAAAEAQRIREAYVATEREVLRLAAQRAQLEAAGVAIPEVPDAPAVIVESAPSPAPSRASEEDEDERGLPAYPPSSANGHAKGVSH